MLIYAHWDILGHRTVQGFSSNSKACAWIIDRLTSIIRQEMANYENKEPPFDLKLASDKIEWLVKYPINLSVEKLQAVINCYEDHQYRLLGKRVPMHRIDNVKLVK